MPQVERLTYLVMCAYYIMQRKQTLVSMRRHAVLCQALDRAEMGMPAATLGPIMSMVGNG